MTFLVVSAVLFMINFLIRIVQKLFTMCWQFTATCIEMSDTVDLQNKHVISISIFVIVKSVVYVLNFLIMQELYFLSDGIKIKELKHNKQEKG